MTVSGAGTRTLTGTTVNNASTLDGGTNYSVSGTSNLGANVTTTGTQT